MPTAVLSADAVEVHQPEVKPEVPIQNYYYLFGAIIREAIKDYARYRYFDERGQVFPDREGVLHYATAKQYLFHPDYLEYTLKKTMIGDHLNIEYIRRKAIEAFQYCMDNDTPDLDWYLTVIKV